MTGINAPSFIPQYIRIDIPDFFDYAVDELAIESKRKILVSVLSHLQDFMYASDHDPINWEDLTHDHMTQYFWVSFATYMGKYSSNKTKVKFSDGNSSASKKSAKSQ